MLKFNLNFGINIKIFITAINFYQDNFSNISIISWLGFVCINLALLVCVQLNGTTCNLRATESRLYSSEETVG